MQHVRVGQDYPRPAFHLGAVAVGRVTVVGGEVVLPEQAVGEGLFQAEALDEILGEDGVKLCINLDIPTELVTARLSARRVCRQCGTIYRDTDPEGVSGTCSKCGGAVIQRADDQPEASRQRLEMYERDTAPLLSFYADRGLLVKVDGAQSPDEVTAAITAAVQRVLS